MVLFLRKCVTYSIGINEIRLLIKKNPASLVGHNL